MTLHPTQLHLDLPTAEARAAALAGTRALIANEQFAALLGLMVEAGVCSDARATALLSGLAERLFEAGAHPAPSHGIATHRPEIAAHVAWLTSPSARVWEHAS
jgi:hypothetical protein